MTAFQIVPGPVEILPRDPSVDPLASARLEVEYFLDPSTPMGLEDADAIFHRWFRDGVLFAGERASYGIGLGRGRIGLRYQCKRRGCGSIDERIASAFRSVLHAMRCFEREAVFSRFCRFRTDSLEFGISDRVFAPNDFTTFARVHPVIASFVSRLYDDPEVEVEHAADPRERFTVQISTSKAPSIDALLLRLSDA